MANTPNIRFKGFADDWEQRKLGEMAEIVGGGTPNTSVDTYWDGDIDWYAPAEIGKQIYLDSSQRKITKEGLNKSSAKILPIGTVLFTSRAGIGKTAILTKEGCTNQGFQSIVPQEDKLDSYFIFSRNKELKRYGETVGAGSTFVEVSGKQMANMDLMIPKTMKEQQAIGRYFANLDHLITFHQHKCNEVKQLKKFMLQKMFPKNGELIPEIRFVGFTGVWEQRKFGEITELKSASRVHKGEWTTEGVPFYRSSDVMAAINGTENDKAFISEELYEKLSSVSGKLEEGDILVTGGGSVGNPYIVPDNAPLYTKDADLLWIKNQGKFNPYFVYEFFLSPSFRSYLGSISHVGTIAHYTITQLSDTPISMPSVEEQDKIGEYFQVLDHLITLHQHKCDQLKEVERFMLQNMFPQKG